MALRIRVSTLLAMTLLLKRKVAKAPRRVALATRNVYGGNMADKDNSVNMKDAPAKAARAYHHGDLRAAVIAAGLKRLAEDAGGELGLRALARDVGVSRSEEHTSELQSLMRISYAVFCLKKKKNHNITI